jgi:D-arabinose 1-dehydrogenase-like Zn-dependent alcohol dehydrogenase
VDDFSPVQKTMKAVVKAKAEPGLWLEEVPVPKVAGDDVLIRVLKASICGNRRAHLQLGRLGKENDPCP